jgi:hypothetical protein
MKWSEFFSSAITGAREAGIEIEADVAPAKTAEPAVPDTSARDAETQAKLAEQAAALATAQAEIETMKAAAQQARFAAAIQGWIGDASAHLQILAALGESTPAYAAYATQQKAVAEQARQSKLFSPVGSEQAGASSAWAQIEAKARALMAGTPGLTKALAIVQAAESDPDLYAQYKAEN